jgi:N-acetylglutamate synthase-like GNAT family acetyltransferase
VGQSTVLPIAIRDAEITDMDDLQRVFRRASLSNEHDRGMLEDHPEQLVLSEEGVRENRMRVAIAEDGRVVGFATHLISDGLAELEDLFVDPRWMRRGIGVALVLDISARLDELHFDKLEVTANPHAMSFYERLGFAVDRAVETRSYRSPHESA